MTTTATADLTVTEYAERIGISAWTLRGYLQSAERRDRLPVRPYALPGSTVRVHWRFPAAEVERVHGGAR